ncbi:MAG: outer membrane lipoprotein carrier protein LolA [Lentisphaeria bacterium]|nr:outer membrane lipoprotein carrier protein LolA [Lentisphaeria bacterium]
MKHIVPVYSCLVFGGIVFCLSMVCHTCRAEEPADEAGQQTLSCIEQAHKKSRALSVRFSQTRRLSFLKRPLRSEGMLVFEEPDHIRFEIATPYCSVMMYDGQAVRCFEHDGEKWHALDQGGAEGIVKLILKQVAGWVHGDFGKESTFSLRVEDASLDKPVIRLTPVDKGVASLIREIRLVFGGAPGYHVATVTIHENGGNSTLLSFAEPEPHESLPPAIFTKPEAVPPFRKQADE